MFPHCESQSKVVLPLFALTLFLRFILLHISLIRLTFSFIDIVSDKFWQILLNAAI